MNRQQLLLILIGLSAPVSFSFADEQIYKWTDAEGRVHYSQRKPADTSQTQTLDIPRIRSTTPAPTDPDAEVARLKALSETMARERQVAEQARQEQLLRAMELANQQLQNQILAQQLQEQERRENQENEDVSGVLLEYPSPYLPAYPYPYPYRRPYPPPISRPYPSPPRSCEPWPACHQPMPPVRPAPPPVKAPIPVFKPKPVGVDLRPDGFIRRP